MHIWYQNPVRRCVEILLYCRCESRAVTACSSLALSRRRIDDGSCVKTAAAAARQIYVAFGRHVDAASSYHAIKSTLIIARSLSLQPPSVLPCLQPQPPFPGDDPPHRQKSTRAPPHGSFRKCKQQQNRTELNWQTACKRILHIF